MLSLTPDEFIALFGCVLMVAFSAYMLLFGGSEWQRRRRLIGLFTSLGWAIENYGRVVEEARARVESLKNSALAGVVIGSGGTAKSASRGNTKEAAKDRAIKMGKEIENRLVNGEP